MKISVVTPTIRPHGLASIQASLMNQTFKDFEWLVDVGFPNKSDLNASLNRLIKRSQGELIVFLQDFISIGPMGLQKFWDAYQVSDQFFTAAVIIDGKDDWRNKKENHGLRNSFMDWEIDWAACSKRALIRIGGFDEMLDQYWGFDNVNAGLRAEMYGYRIICIDNMALGEKHEEAFMKKDRNPEYHNFRLQQIRQGLRVDYLSS